MVTANIRLTIFGKCAAVIVICFVTLHITPPSIALACSGGGAEFTLADWLEASDVVVRGHIVQVDELSQNGFLQVESYLKGESGPQRIAIQQADPALVAGQNYILSSGGECSPLKASLNQGTNAYFFLRQQANGVYTTPWRNIPLSYFNFPTDTATQRICLRANDSSDQCFDETNVTDAEFTRLIIQATGRQPQLPLAQSFDPLQSPILLTTSVGSNYLLPLDGSAPVKITADNANDLGYGAPNVYAGADFLRNLTCESICNVQLSADRFFSARKHDAKTIAVGYRFVSERDHMADVLVEGKGYAFAPLYPWLAVWDADHLAIYSLEPPISDAGILGGTYESNLAPTLNTGAVNMQRQAITWRPKSTEVAFSNASGLWLWSFRSDQPATLLVTPDAEGNIPEARFFSASGRYLTFQRGNQSALLDMTTGAILPAGLVSPDDLYIALTETDQESHSTHVTAICAMTLLTGQIKSDDCYVADEQFLQFEWKTSHEFWYLACQDQTNSSCRVLLGRVATAQLGITLSDIDSQPYARFNNVSTFAYDPATEHMALLLDSDTIVRNGQSMKLADQLDGAITTMQWLPSFFCTTQ
jgi:hypothetical protein